MALAPGVIDAIESLDEARRAYYRSSPLDHEDARRAVAAAERRLRVAFAAAAARGWVPA